jgi:hypothetical protein
MSPVRVLLAAFIYLGAGASAQAQIVAQAPVDPARWDVASHTGWTGGHKADVGAEWDRWYEAWSGGATAGFYLTPNVKAELQTLFTHRARLSGYTLVPVPVQSFPAYQPEEHQFTAAAVSAGVAYQFGTNQWFHPFVAGGVDVMRERHEAQRPAVTIPGRGFGEPPVIIPAGPAIDRVDWSARPFAGAGFKLYMTERAFIRSELRSTFSTRGVDYVTWAAGIGVDL